MATRSSLLLTSSAAFLVGQATSFVLPSNGRLASPSTLIVHSELNNNPVVIDDNDNVTQEMGVNNQVNGVEEKEDERVYYKILSEANPTSKSIFSAGDVLKNNNNGSSASSYYQPINGWVPKEDYALWGLPGAIAPVGFFDPIGFAREGLPLNDAKRLREAEVQHGRVAMMATIGYWAAEAIPNGGPFHITGPANDQLQQVPAPAFWFMTILIAAAELYRAKKGWVEPKLQIGSKTLWTLRDNYYPGDLGFDPLGLKPTENYEFQKMQTKELSHGRLAMLGWAGMCSQELVNHRTIGETLDFYFTIFSGGNPYDGYYY